MDRPAAMASSASQTSRDTGSIGRSAVAVAGIHRAASLDHHPSALLRRRRWLRSALDPTVSEHDSITVCSWNVLRYANTRAYNKKVALIIIIITLGQHTHTHTHMYAHTHTHTHKPHIQALEPENVTSHGWHEPTTVPHI